MKKSLYHIVSLKKIVILIAVVSLSTFAHSQDANNNEAETEKELGGVIEAFLDWASLSFATYTGQHEAELGSVFAKAKEGLAKYPELQNLINDNSGGQGGALAEGVNTLTTKTGVKVYFLPQMANPDGKFYINSFNGFLAESSTNLIPPYILVKINVSGSNTGGYTLSTSVETSDDVKANKYNLKEMNTENPFYALNTTVPKRKDMASHLKLSLYNGIGALHSEMDGSLRADLSILQAGTLYREGEEVEVAYDKDKPTVLTVEDKDGQAPSKKVTWVLDPAEAEYEADDNQLTLAPQAGQWKVTASAGNKSTHVFLKSVDFNLDWRQILKEILKEVVNESVAAARTKIDSLASDTASYHADIQSQRKVLLEREGYTVSSTNPTFSSDIYFEEVDDSQEMTQAELDQLLKDDQINEFVELHRKWYIVTAEVLLQLNIETFLNTLIDDPKRMDDFVSEVKNSSPELILSLVANLVTRPEGRLDIKKLLIDHLNQQINQVANAE